MIIDPVKLLERHNMNISRVARRRRWPWCDSWIIRGGAGDDAAENLRVENRQAFWPSHPSVSFRLSLTLPRTE